MMKLENIKMDKIFGKKKEISGQYQYKERLDTGINLT